jgi:hypothetical protein
MKRSNRAGNSGWARTPTLVIVHIGGVPVERRSNVAQKATNDEGRSKEGERAMTKKTGTRKASGVRSSYST